METEKNTASIKPIDRKQFLKTAGSTALFAFLGIKLVGCDVTSSSDEPDPDENGNGNGDDITDIIIDGNTVTLNLDAPTLAELRNAGGWMVIGQAALIVVNIDGNLIRAFTNVCPHAGCNDSWQYNNERFICTCHNSTFQNDGTFVSGPAGRDLPEFSVDRDENIVTITK